MNFERTDLIVALDRVKPALAFAGSIPELKHVWVDKKYMYAYNGALGIRIDWPNELTPCGIAGGTLLGLLQSSSAKEITLTQSSATQLDLKMGRASATIPVFAAQHNPWNFPDKLPPGPVGVRTLTLTEEVLTGLKQARLIEARKKVRVEHWGVVLFPGKDDLVLYSTDSKTMAEVPVAGKVAKELEKAILPHEFVAQLIKLEAGAKVSFLKDAIVAEATGTRVCTNLLDSAGVHDLPGLVNKTTTGKEKHFAVPEGFGEALERALVLAAGMDRDKAFVTLSTAKKELMLEGTLDGGLLKEKFALTTAPGEGEMEVGLDRLKGLYKEAEAIAIGAKALLLYGKNDALFLIAAHGE